MRSAAPAAGGCHLLPEQEEQAALQQEGQEGSVSRGGGRERRGYMGLNNTCIFFKNTVVLLIRMSLIQKDVKQTPQSGSIKKTVMV